MKTTLDALKSLVEAARLHSNSCKCLDPFGYAHANLWGAIQEAEESIKQCGQLFEGFRIKNSPELLAFLRANSGSYAANRQHMGPAEATRPPTYEQLREMMVCLNLCESDRQMVLLALAVLSIDSPGFDYALNLIALQIDNNKDGRARMYDGFRKSRSKPT